MDEDHLRNDPTVLTRLADRCDALGETAELMGDTAGATQLRERAAGLRLRAMTLLDD